MAARARAAWRRRRLQPCEHRARHEQGPNLATLRAQRLAHPPQEERHQPRRALAQISTQAAGRAGDQRLLAVVGGGSVRVVGVGPVRVQTWLGLGVRVLGAMPNAQCNAQCPTPNSQCQYAQCPMPNAHMPNAQLPNAN